MDHQDRELRGSSRSPLVPARRGNTQDLPRHLAGSRLVTEYLDNIHLHRELRGSSPPAPEPPGSSPGSSLGSTHLKELQDSYPEAPFLTQLDRLPPAPELLLGLIQMCLTQVASQEGATACTDRAVQVDSPLQLALVDSPLRLALADSPLQLALALSLPSLLEAFPRYPLGHGDHMQVEASLLPLAPTVPALGPWVRMVDPLHQEACCQDITHRITEKQ